MERITIHENFIAFMEAERIRRGLTIAGMAALLQIPYATYKNIIYHKSECIDISIACKLYDLTRRMMWQMCGYITSDSVFLDQYASLSESDKRAIRLITAALAAPEVE